MKLSQLLAFLLLAGASFAWWDAAFPYRTQVSISNSGSNLTDYQVSINLNTQALVSAGKMRPDCADLRFVDSNDSSQLPFWIESGCNTTATRIWAKVPSIPSGTSPTYLYYGNSSAVTVTNGNSTFDFFDDFTGSSIDTSKWTVDGAGGLSVTGSEAIMVQAGGKIRSVKTLSQPFIIETKLRSLIGTTGQGFSAIGTWASTSSGFGLQAYGMPGGSMYRFNNGGWGAITAYTVDANPRIYRMTAASAAVNLSILPLNRSTVDWTYGEAYTVSSQQIRIGQRYDNGGTTEAQDERWDWVLVRKYASPEPTTSILSEEAALQFTYRKEFTLNNPGSALTDYQVNLTMDTAAQITAGKMKNDCSDIRFTNSTSYNTQDWAASYKYWIESGCNTSATKIWVKVPSIPAGTSTIYAYYGNESAANASNGTNTFAFFDDFDDGIIDANKWTATSLTESGGTINTASNNARLLSKYTFVPANISVEGRGSVNSAQGYYYSRMLIVQDTAVYGDPNYALVGTASGTTFFAARNGAGITLDYTTPFDGSYHRMVLQRTNGNFYATFDSQTKNISAGIPTATSYIGAGTDTDGGGLNLDWVFVRKYVSPEPTATELLPDTTAPSVQIQSPTSQAYNTSSVNVNFTATDAVGVSSCTVRLNGTVNSSTCSNYSLALSNGAYLLNVTANDTSGNINSSQVSFTVAVVTDTTPPAITIQAPANVTYTTGTVPVNFMATDDTGVSSCAVRLNGTINSTTCSNYSLTLGNGAYTLNVSANDSFGNLNSTQVSFTVAIPPGPQSNTTQATTDNEGIASGNLSFTFTPGTLRINAGAQEQTKAVRASAGVNKIALKAKVTLGGQVVTGKQVTYTIS